MASHPDVPRSPASNISHLSSSARRLTRALDVLDDGDLSGADDLAAILRILIGTQKGNNLLLKVASQESINAGRVLASASPPDDVNVMLSVGNFPTPAADETGRGGEHWMEFRSWILATSLIQGRTRSRKTSWAKLADIAGNSTGSHVSTTVPDVLIEASLFGTAGYSLYHYLLRQVGWQVEQTLGALLVQLDEPVPRLEPRSVQTYGVSLRGLHFSLPNPDVLATIESRCTELPVRIIEFDFHGKYSTDIDVHGNVHYTTPHKGQRWVPDPAIPHRLIPFIEPESESDNDRVPGNEKPPRAGRDPR